jgi:hypothetical protein
MTGGAGVKYAVPRGIGDLTDYPGNPLYTSAQKKTGRPIISKTMLATDAA